MDYASSWVYPEDEEDEQLVSAVRYTVVDYASSWDYPEEDGLVSAVS